MAEIVQSAGGILYCLDENREPKYLIIKRHALSGKIERVAPKGKIQKGEKIEETALRETSEECWIPLNQLRIKQQIWTTSLRSSETKRGHLDKDVTYFLMHYTGNPEMVKITDGEGYIGIHKWASIQEILALLYYGDIRELFRKAHLIIQNEKKNNLVKENFLKKL